MNDKRVDLVTQAFKVLDINDNGIVALKEIEQLYDTTFHPKFKSGENTKKEILKEFMEQWDTIEKDGSVSLAEFIE